MPRQSKKQGILSNQQLNDLLQIDKFSSSPELSNDDENTASPKKIAKSLPKLELNPRKRPSTSAFKEETDEFETSTDVFSGEMYKMLECFSMDMQKSLTTKRKKLQQITQASLKASTKKVDDFLKIQQNERQKMNEELTRQMLSILEGMESDLQKTKEQEEKLQKSIIQQQKFLQQAHIAHGQRIKSIRQLLEQYKAGCEIMENAHENQHNQIQNELKKELTLLQKKILTETQQQEIANVRKSLQSMLF